MSSSLEEEKELEKQVNMYFDLFEYSWVRCALTLRRDGKPRRYNAAVNDIVSKQERSDKRYCLSKLGIAVLQDERIKQYMSEELIKTTLVTHAETKVRWKI